jgi:hypothetical protein
VLICINTIKCATSVWFDTIGSKVYLACLAAHGCDDGWYTKNSEWYCFCQTQHCFINVSKCTCRSGLSVRISELNRAHNLQRLIERNIDVAAIKYYWRKTSQFKASCKDWKKLQQSWTYKTAEISSRTRHVRPWSVWRPYKTEQTYSGHSFRAKLLLKLVVSLLENRKAAGLLFLWLTKVNSG